MVSQSTCVETRHGASLQCVGNALNSTLLHTDEDRDGVSLVRHSPSTPGK
ncbi:hypothetical protein [Coleofasciculus sp. G2-EDA-02]